jgi:hypothetical protein
MTTHFIENTRPEHQARLPPEAPQVNTDQESWYSSKKVDSMKC